MTVSIIVLVDYRVYVLSGGIIVSCSDLSILVFKLKHIYLDILLDDPVMHNNM